jgi:hypothetical protein
MSFFGLFKDKDKYYGGTKPRFLNADKFRVLRIANTPAKMIYDLFYDHGKGTDVIKDRVKFYLDGKGFNYDDNNNAHVVKSMTTGYCYTEKKAKRFISILITADYELRRNPNSDHSDNKSFWIMEDNVIDKLEKLGL